MLHEALAPVVVGVEFGVPFPIMVIPTPLGTLIPEVQVQEPGGMLMVSPLTAVCVGPLMMAFTSDQLQDAAVWVPCAFTQGAKKRKMINEADREKNTCLLILSILCVTILAPPPRPILT